METHLLIDNSNIWIGECQQDSELSSMPGSWIRVDFGMLSALAANGRNLTSCSLYGSKPPPNDSLWANAQGLGYECHSS